MVAAAAQAPVVQPRRSSAVGLRPMRRARTSSCACFIPAAGSGYTDRAMAARFRTRMTSMIFVQAAAATGKPPIDAP